MKSGRYIVGLDIGTTKVCAVVGRSSGQNVEVAAFGLSASNGIRKGVVVDIDATVESIKDSVKKAETSSGLSIETAYVGIAGSHIKCLESYGAVGIKGKEVTKKDIERVIESASSVYVPLDREVLHILASDFIVDGQDGIIQPVGMSGVRLEAKVNIITVSQSIIENLLKCCEKAGIKAADVVLEPIASSRSVLRDDEIKAGVALIDIGGGTTDIAVYKDGRLKHTSVIPIGGNHLTSDIAIGLRVSQKEAERVKELYGSALTDLASASEIMEVFSINGEEKKIPRRYMAEIIRPRCQELFELVKAEIKDTMLYSAVLTGGTSLLSGIDKAAEAVIGIGVRTGVGPLNNLDRLKDETHFLSAGGAISPIYSTAIGLMLYGIDMEDKNSIHRDILNRVSEWFGGLNIIRAKQSLKANN